MEERKEAWLPEETLKLIEDYLKSFPIRLGEGKAKVFEFGGGASTEWLANMCKVLVSVEHDKEWAKITADKISEINNNDENTCNIIFVQHDIPYNEVIEEYADKTFDLILVDGRNRVKCIESAIPKLKSGGWLVLDNSEREYYKPAIDMMADWNQVICKQNRPDKYGFTYPNWQCTIFIKP